MWWWCVCVGGEMSLAHPFMAANGGGPNYIEVSGQGAKQERTRQILTPSYSWGPGGCCEGAVFAGPQSDSGLNDVDAAPPA